MANPFESTDQENPKEKYDRLISEYVALVEEKRGLIDEKDEEEGYVKNADRIAEILDQMLEIRNALSPLASVFDDVTEEDIASMLALIESSPMDNDTHPSRQVTIEYQQEDEDDRVLKDLMDSVATRRHGVVVCQKMKMRDDNPLFQNARKLLEKAEEALMRKLEEDGLLEEDGSLPPDVQMRLQVSERMVEIAYEKDKKDQEDME